MIKIKTILLIMINIILFSSCSIGGSRINLLNQNTEEEIIAERIEQIIAAIQEEDIDLMKSLFSNNSLGEIEDFDSDFDYLIGFIQGSIEPWDEGSWFSYESVKYGKRTLNINSKYTIKTDQETYLFYIIDFPEDTINPNNEGLATLRVIKAEDEEKEFTYWEDMDVGIYKPEE